MYRIVEAPGFAKEFRALAKDVRDNFSIQFKRVQEDPFKYGRPLGTPWLRKLKHKKFRVYYAIDNQAVIVLLIDISDKKNQQSTIERIRKTIKTCKGELVP